jgi:hypothetical protein
VEAKEQSIMRLRIFACGCLATLTAGSAQAAIGVLDEADLGALSHDVQIGGEHHEPGVDGNAELRFVSPGFLAPIFAPRPNLGVEINSAGKNSYTYAGLVWRAPLFAGLFADLGLGGAIHDGPNRSSTIDHKGLGTRVLFHESMALGYQFTSTWSAAAYIDHVSNADIGRSNPGLTNIGARLGYLF